MSISAMVAVRDYSITSLGKFIVMLMIADMLNDDQNCAWCDLKTLADRARLKPSTLRKIISELVEQGELIVENPRRKIRRYFIPILEDEAGYDPQPCAERHDCNRFHTPLSITRARTRERRRSAPEQKAETEEIVSEKPLNNSERQNVANATNQRTLNNSIATKKSLNNSTSSLDNSEFGKPFLTEPLRTHNKKPNARERAREDITTNFENENDAGQAEPTTPPPPPSSPPAPARPAKGEKVGLWRDATYAMAHYGLTEAQIGPMRSAHLYEISSGVYRLYVPIGDPVGFKMRFEGPILQALTALTRRGNLIVEYAR